MICAEIEKKSIQSTMAIPDTGKIQTSQPKKLELEAHKAVSDETKKIREAETGKPFAIRTRWEVHWQCVCL